MSGLNVSYSVSASLSDEVTRMRFTSHQLERNPMYPRLPGDIVRNIKSLIDDMSDEEILSAVNSDLVKRTDVSVFEDEIGIILDKLNADFFSRIDINEQWDIPIHVTAYGQEGSYHPTGMYWGARGANGMYRGPQCITVKDPVVATWRRPFIHLVVHETIELIMHPSVELAGYEFKVKEAIVDKFCSCKELVTIYGDYKMQNITHGVVLPTGWQKLIPWRSGQIPTW